MILELNNRNYVLVVFVCLNVWIPYVQVVCSDKLKIPKLHYFCKSEVPTLFFSNLLSHTTFTVSGRKFNFEVAFLIFFISV